MNNERKSNAGRKPMSETRKRKKLGSTVNPDIHAAALAYMAKEGMEQSEFLTKAAEMLLLKEAPELLREYQNREHRTLKPNHENTPIG